MIRPGQHLEMDGPKRRHLFVVPREPEPMSWRGILVGLVWTALGLVVMTAVAVGIGWLLG